MIDSDKVSPITPIFQKLNETHQRADNDVALLCNLISFVFFIHHSMFIRPFPFIHYSNRRRTSACSPVASWTFDLPAMPLGGLGRMSLCLGPVTMIIPPSFEMHGRRVFDVHSLLAWRLRPWYLIVICACPACPVAPGDGTGGGIAPQKHPKGFNWGEFHRGSPR